MKKAIVTINVGKKVNRTWTVVDAPTPNWGMKQELNLSTNGYLGAGNRNLIDMLACHATMAASFDDFEFYGTLTELMQSPGWKLTTQRSGLVPAWYYVYWKTVMAPKGEVINPARVIKWQDPAAEKTFTHTNKGKTNEMYVYPEEMFLVSWKKQRHAEGSVHREAADPYWVEQMKQNPTYKKIYVWADWDIAQMDREISKKFWSTMIYKLAQVGDPSKVRVHIAVDVVDEVKEAPELPNIQDVPKQKAA